MEVDRAGITMKWIDRYTAEIHKVYLFVATLPYSPYTFIKPAESMVQEEWIGCNVAALRFFGGSPRIIVPNNLRTGASLHTRDEMVLNRTFQEFGNHYGLAVIPTGVCKSRHKPSVEGNAEKSGKCLMLRLRNQRFFSMADLNSHSFKKRADGGRQEVFLAKEKPMLAPLPPTDFEPGRWLGRTVSPACRVTVDNVTYTVPYIFVGQKVDVRVGRAAVEVF